MNKKWEKLYSEFIHWEFAEISEQRSIEIDRLKEVLAESFNHAGDKEKETLREILIDSNAEDHKKYFVAGVLWNAAFKKFPYRRHIFSTTYRTSN